MNKHKTGLVLGSLIGLIHLLWSILVGLGWAQPLMDFIFKMHSLNNPYSVLPFDLMRSIGLVVITFCIGYIIGNLFAMFWNKFQK